MDTLSRHKSFLLASAVLLLASIFTPQTDHPAEDIVPVESHINSEGIVRCFYSSQDLSCLYHTLHHQSKLTISIQLATTTTTSHSMDSTSGQSSTDSKAINVDAGTLPHDTKLDPDCVFCKIVTGEAPSFKVYETKYSLAFLAKPPVSHGHTLIIPKYHSRTLTDPGLPDEFLADVGPIMKKIAVMNGEDSYNIIQNNGRTAGQSVHHVHFHVVTKPVDKAGQGLVLTPESWPSYPTTDAEYAHDAAQMKQIGRDHGFPGVSA